MFYYNKYRQLIHSTAINRTERDLIELKYFEIL